MIYYNRKEINKSSDETQLAIELEHKRNNLAKNKDFKLLKSTYKPDLPEIEDNNSSAYWKLLNSSSDVLEKSPVYKHKLLTVGKYIKKNKGNILNIGVGSGTLEKIQLTENLELQKRWFGIDFDAESIKRATGLYKKSTFKLMLLEKMRFPPKMFSLILALDILEHIPPKTVFPVLKNIKKVLKTNGKVIISVPVNEGLEKMLKLDHNPNAHLRIYTKELLEAELIISGFRISKIIQLYAFKNIYNLKFLLVKLLKLNKNPNLLIVVAQKK